MTVKFRSPFADQPIYVALTSGHSMIIPVEGIDVPEPFHAQAILNGAVPVAGRALTTPIRAAMAERQGMIAEAVTAMFKSQVSADFLEPGVLNMRRLNDRTGFHVFKEEADAALAEAKAEAEAAEV